MSEKCIPSCDMLIAGLKRMIEPMLKNTSDSNRQYHSLRLAISNMPITCAKSLTRT